jgi:hypothetical protein
MNEFVGPILHTETDQESKDYIELTDTTDFVPYNKVSEDILKVLSQHPKAAYTVYLNLCSKFGTGNGM